MENGRDKMQRFFTACDDLITGKFILADTKINELLRSIATNSDLTGLFSAVTARFDYAAVKSACLKTPAGIARGEAFLPSERSDVLAFVFCLLTDFDSGAIKFNDFLLRYFYEDGSYTASYSLFVNRMIRPFRDIVRECFPNAGVQTGEALSPNEEGDILTRLYEKIALERVRVGQLPLGKEDAIAGEMILSELAAAVQRGGVNEVKALLCGYLYYLQAVDGSSLYDNEIFLLAEEL